MPETTETQALETHELEQEIALVRTLVRGIKGQYERALWCRHLHRLEARLRALRARQETGEQPRCA